MKMPTYSHTMTPEEVASWGFTPAQWMTDEDWQEWEAATGQRRPANSSQAASSVLDTRRVEKMPTLPTEVD